MPMVVVAEGGSSRPLDCKIPVRPPRHTIFAAASAAEFDSDHRSEAISDAAAVVWLSRSGAVLCAIRFDAEGQIIEDFRIWFAGFELRVQAGCRITCDDARGALLIEASGAGVSFGAAPVRGGRIEIASGARPGAGRIHFSATLSRFDASIRYFYQPDPNVATLARFAYPFTAPALNSIDVNVSMDPGDPLNAASNRLALAADGTFDSAFLSTTGLPITLAIIPDESGFAPQWDPVRGTSYLTPNGNWRLVLAGAPSASSVDVLCGLSGLEYARVTNGSIVRFVAGGPAFAPSFHTVTSNGGQAPTATGAKSLTQGPNDPPLTTAWVYFPTAAGSAASDGYYSQPHAAGLFHAAGFFLAPVSVRAAAFPPNASPAWGAPGAAFPMVPYAGVEAASAAEDYRRFELEVLGIARNDVIAELDATLEQETPGAPPALIVREVVTPQGLLSIFTDDLSRWLWLILAQNQNGPLLALKNLAAPLRTALLGNQLFLVIDDPDTLLTLCEAMFQPINIGGQNGGWNFNLSPSAWRKNPPPSSGAAAGKLPGGTVMIIKFAEKSFQDLVNDASLWSAPASGLASKDAQSILQQSIAQAKANSDQPEFQYFLNTVLQDWNGILFVNVPVPAGDFPQQLLALSAGIDMQNFVAHHLGVDLAPLHVDGGTIEVAEASLFGLIFYQDPNDLTYKGVPYDFKTLSLRVLFANSNIASFSSKIELLIGQLFSERSTLPDTDPSTYHGDNLILLGSWQQHGGENAYSFIMQGADTFGIASQVLDTVLITKAQMVTLDPPPGSTTYTARFLLWGSLRFRLIEVVPTGRPDGAAEPLDLFSFGPDGEGASNGLQFSNLFVSMSFEAANASATRVFAFQAGQMSFDPPASVPRAQSLYARFPVQATNMLQGTAGANGSAATTPASLGYIVMDTPPLPTGSLGATWFGLEMPLNLGSAGALAAKAGLKATLLVAWAPSATAPNVAAAIRLPGSHGTKSLTIEGPLKLDIGDIALIYNQTQKAYLIRFQSIALGFLSLKFPPDGKTNLLLFGDPNPQASNTTLGWYAAYKKNAPSGGQPGFSGPGDGSIVASATNGPITEQM
jgi:hypothetical protein